MGEAKHVWSAQYVLTRS